MLTPMSVSLSSFPHSTAVASKHSLWGFSREPRSILHKAIQVNFLQYKFKNLSPLKITSGFPLHLESIVNIFSCLNDLSQSSSPTSVHPTPPTSDYNAVTQADLLCIFHVHQLLPNSKALKLLLFLPGFISISRHVIAKHLT